MPELPEVETVRRDLSEYLVGVRFTTIKFIDFKNVAPAAAFLARYLKGTAIIALRRRGKLLIFDLEKVGKTDKHLLFHLKMTGQLIFARGKELKAGGHSLIGKNLMDSIGGKLPNKYTRAYFEFDSGGCLYFNDLRKFGYIRLVGTEELDKILKNDYGPEPMDKEFTAEWLSSLVAKRTAPIKSVILNQKLIAGLGNIYADESLFLAKINPQRPANTLKPAEVKELHKAIIAIINRAIKARGTTFRNYVDANGKKGSYINFLQVYGRDKLSCYRCGRTIRKIKVGGRGTHYCGYCQK